MTSAPSVAEQPTLAAATYFTFRWAETTYGVESPAVVEVFFLPAFTLVPELPRYMVGVLNVRGEILPLLDVQLRLGQTPEPYQVSDRVIILAAMGQRFGIIVQDIYGIETLTPAQLQTHWQSLAESVPAAGASSNGGQNGVQTGLATHEKGIVVVLEPELILKPPTSPQTVDLENLQALTPETIAALRQSLDEATQTLTTTGQVYADTTPAAQQIRRDRAAQLAQVPEQASREQQQTAIAILKLGTEWLGLDVTTIREFTEIQQLTPIPCCPAHILGNTNLRGEIITLVDISTFLALPPLPTGDRWPAVIVETADLILAIAVSAVVDIHLYDPTAIHPMPLAVQGAAREVIEGAIAYQSEMVSRLSLARLLDQEGFRVKDEG
ncbi:MAG: chemotaxis protein CheW [Spirulinaceae cyanobacterium]